MELNVHSKQLEKMISLNRYEKKLLRMRLINFGLNPHKWIIRQNLNDKTRRVFDIIRKEDKEIEFIGIAKARRVYKRCFDKNEIEVDKKYDWESLRLK